MYKYEWIYFLRIHEYKNNEAENPGLFKNIMRKFKIVSEAETRL